MKSWVKTGLDLDMAPEKHPEGCISKLEALQKLKAL